MKLDDVRVFLAVRRAGSIKGAARGLGVDHSTISRRISALEEALETKLFVRSDGALVATRPGEAITPLAEQIEETARNLERVAKEASGCLARTMRIAVSPVVSTYFLIPRLPALRARFPDIEFAVKADIATADIAKGEADVAIRQHPPDRSPVSDGILDVTRVGSFGLAAYASDSYFERCGRPVTPVEGLEGHELVVASAKAPGAVWNQALCPPAAVVLTAFPYASMMAVAASGTGIAVLPCLAASADTRLHRIGALVASWDLHVASLAQECAPANVREVRAAIIEMLEAGATEISGR